MKFNEYVGNQMTLTLTEGVYRHDIDAIYNEIVNDKDEYSKYEKYNALQNQCIEAQKYLQSLGMVYLYGTHRDIGYVLDEEKYAPVESSA